ncbi:hypothetical protein [Actinokineospora diospyrosa]|uniref:Excreted virulence factor EspC (Type VII ESX diderm) n=1 Tax=Actinokineospora diospyrosa TaxID=103728 RepID=A0ABT1IAX3_9PSEU|nr:hypothetical protein [Actinokineospora diospyrosa]MCP2269719.1 hypothetical protein [Actinokineospora diospyrosa]
MAPPDRQPDRSHPAASGADPEFGHAAEIAAWVEWLLHPEQHQYDRMVILPDGTRVEQPGNLTVERRQLDPNGPLVPDPKEPTEYYPFESVIAGCYPEQFFDPALALSGQLFDEDSDISKVYAALIDASWRSDDWNGKLNGGFEDLRQEWSGSAAAHAGEFLGAIEDFATDFTQVTRELAALAIAYAGVVKAARTNLNEAMGTLVDAFHAKFYAHESLWDTVVVKALSAIAAAALTYVSGGAAAAAWGAGLATAIDKALDSDDGDGTGIGGKAWREIVDNYFVAQMKILRHAGAEIDKLRTDASRLGDRLASMPKLPG